MNEYYFNNLTPITKQQHQQWIAGAKIRFRLTIKLSIFENQFNCTCSMETNDIRWKQRFQNYEKALNQLKKFVDKGKELNELEEQGLIKAFEFTYELAWNTIKDFYESQGEAGIQGSKDAFQLAFKRGLITNGEVWMKMLLDRNRTSHTYNEKTADEIGTNILNSYYQNFTDLALILKSLY